MIALCGLGAGRRLLQRRMLLERFVIDLHPPPSLVELDNVVVIKRQVIGYEIAHPGRTVFVVKDFCGQEQRKRDVLQPQLPGLADR